VLLYHSIKEIPKNKDPLRITVPPMLFEKQIRYLLSSGYKILPMDAVPDYLSGRVEITGKEIVLTFDDGFDDNFEAAIGVLSKNRIPATYFLSCDHIGAEEIFPWCTPQYSYSKPITMEKVLGLISMNMSIGSHTRTHPNLGDISHDRDRLYEEIAMSKKILEDKLKVPIKYFAYPFGSNSSYNKTTERIVKESGYKAAFTNIFGSNKNGDNIFELKRTRITWDDNLFRFKMKLEGAYDWTDHFR